jgi:hypothetical protein
MTGGASASARGRARERERGRAELTGREAGPSRRARRGNAGRAREKQDGPRERGREEAARVGNFFCFFFFKNVK